MFKSLWKVFLIVMVIVFAFYFPQILTSFSTWFTGLTGWTMSASVITAVNSTWWVGLAVGLGLAYVIDPATTSEIVRDTGKAVVEVAGAAVTGVTSSWMGIAAIVAGGWLLLGRSKKTEGVGAT